MELTRVLRYLRDRKVKVAIVLILLVAAGLRLYGINWDQGYGFHPDERSIYMQSDCMYRILSNSQNYQDCNILKDFPDIEPGFPSTRIFFDSDRSPFNPHWFPLGSILIYLLVLIRFLLEPFLELNTFDMRFVGRSLSALADVSSVYFLFLLGRRLFNQRVGLLSATLMAITVIHIQISHFYRPETFIVLFVLASFWFMLNVLEEKKLKDWIFLGVFVGLTFATKVSVLPVFIPLLILGAFCLLGCYNDSDVLPRSSKVYRLIRHAITGSVVAVSVFFILTPYAFIDLPKFVSDTTWEASVAREAGKMPYTVQYIGATPFIYELKQSTIWALGVPLGIVAWCGLLYSIYCAMRRKDNWKGNLLLLGWVLPNFLLIGWFFEVKFLRYIFPIIPFLILFGSRWLVSLLDGVKTWHSTVNATTAKLKPVQHIKAYGPILARGVIGVVIVTSFLYTLGFMSVYSRPHPAVAASDWINQNVPRGSTIITDNHWDEGIPGIYSYDVRQIPIYNGETKGNMKRIARDLSEAQYLIFYSNRTYGSIARTPEKYPYSSHYYHLLFSGDLGYKFDRAFTSYPKLLGVALKNDTFSRATLPEPEELKATKSAALTLNMGFADENVMNYDHPAVLLFKNVEGLQQERIFKALTPESLKNSTEVSLKLMLTTEEVEVQRQGGTWSDIVKTDSWSNKVPVLAWILLVELIYLASIPLAFFVFRPLPDRGMIVARVLGILCVSYIAWLLASLHLLSFSRISMWVGLLVLTLLSSLVLLQSWRELLGFLRRSWRFLAVGEALFLGAFLIFVILRMANPDLWEPWLGGEKPMDFAYLNAILRSSYMPPFDPWFSGGYLNYYYWGQFIIANLIKATGILPSVAYNLAVPLLFALTVTSAFSIVYNVSEGLRKTWRAPENSEETDGRRIAMTLTWLKTPVAAGLLAALFVAVIANLDGAIQLVQLGWKGVVRGGMFDNFDFWRSSRMLPPLADLKPSFLTFWLPDRVVLPAGFCFTQLNLDNTCPDISHHITEFPFFSFLFGDLHAHVIAIPFTLLTLSLGLAFLVGLRQATREWIIAVVPILAVALGSLWAINSWDYPAYLLLTLAMFAVGACLMVERNGHTRRVRTFIGITIPTILLSVLAFLPFHIRYETFGALIRISKWQTPLVNYLGIHGLFVFLILMFFIYLNRVRLKRVLLRPIRSHPPAQNGISQRGREKTKFTWEAAALLVSMVLIICLVIAGYWTAAFLLALIVLGASAVHEEFSKLNDGSGFMLFPIIIAGFAFLIAIGVEFLRVGNDIGRINTLFKFYLDAWVLLSLAAAISMWYLARQGLFSFGNLPNSRRLILWVITIIITVLILDFIFWIAVMVDWSRISYHIGSLDTLNEYSALAVILSVVLVLLLIPVLIARGAFYFKNMLLAKALMITLLASLVFSSLIYTVLGTRARLSHRFDTHDMTLNGEAFMSKAVHMEQDTAFELKWDYDAILWLRNNVQGSPVVMEAHTEQYRWGGRIATYTGLPTVLGWPWHQIQQRGDYFVILERALSVEETYSTVDPYRALEIFDTYAVKYVVVGQLERIFYPKSGIAKFQSMVDEGLLSVAYRNLGTTIYEVASNAD